MTGCLVPKQVIIEISARIHSAHVRVEPATDHLFNQKLCFYRKTSETSQFLLFMILSNNRLVME